MITIISKQRNLPPLIITIAVLFIASFIIIKFWYKSDKDLTSEHTLRSSNSKNNDLYNKSNIYPNRIPSKNSSNQLSTDKSKGLLYNSDPQTLIDTQENKNMDPELRYRKLLSLMTSSVYNLSETEKKQVIEKILNELPLVVRDGKMHPSHAVLAHTMLLERLNKPANTVILKAIEEKYKSLYPHNLNYESSPHLD